MSQPSPSLPDLPDPPPGKTGWPWTMAPNPLSETLPNGTTWPEISVVTPSYNQAEYLEAAVRSVLLQGYPNLQYIVRDGGSTDGSVEILEKYDPWINEWKSAPDEGQSNAINWGLRRIQGDIWAYLNSDDFYVPGAFGTVGRVFANEPETLWVTGTGEYFRGDPDNVVEAMEPVPCESLSQAMLVWKGEEAVIAAQVANFMRSEVLDAYGYFDESLHFAMDVDFGLRLLVDGIRPHIVPDVLAKARLHEASKTVSQSGGGAFREEQYAIIDRFLDALDLEERQYVRKEVRTAKMHDRLDAALNAGSAIDGFSLLSKELLRNPGALTRRSFWGALRRLSLSALVSESRF